ncbi:MAG: AarF/ABC1/UbiB kinase family protein [Erysipelotrichales bacterium]|nr:AarF/ABC1/UbiB kinase family protein [Erysipelotrichales bacterium]
MKLYYEVIKLLFRKYILRYDTGKAIRIFCEHMGIAYVKAAQMLTSQNIGDLFTEKDRLILSSICDNYKRLPFSEIKTILEEEYKTELDNVFMYIDSEPVGSASISQVHKAVLKSGEVVAVKVKRKDITNKIEKDLKDIRNCVHRFGKFFKYNNFVGGDHALELYLKWLDDETDFNHEKENIKLYQNFAEKVNGKIPDTKNILVPKLYEDLCTENVIVMEFVNSPTLTEIQKDEENNEIIATAINSYLKSSFYAFFHNEQIVFHGDPHNGNVYIDDDGNIGFLDMGLLFVLTEEEADLLRKLFFTAYACNYEKLYDLLMPFSKMPEKEKGAFKEELKIFCSQTHEIKLSEFYTKMITVCLGHEIVPPDFLFSMAKTMVILNGTNNVFDNNLTVEALLMEQIIDYFFRRSMSDAKDIALDILKLSTKVVQDIISKDAYQSLVSEYTEIVSLYDNLLKCFANSKEMLDIFKASTEELKKKRQ